MRLYKKVFILFIIACTLLMPHISVYAATPAEWHAIKGTYARDDNNQYSDGTLSLMYLDNDVVMFEFFMVEGSEGKDVSNNFCLAGAFYLDDNGIGIYQHPKTGDTKITFDLANGKVTVKQTGKLPINVSGKYGFVESYIKVTENAAIEILEQLPTAVTSLNHNNGEYKLAMSEEMVDGWFYDVKANFVDTNALIAEFYIARDMSAVYRVDTDTPILIWGSAQPMLGATYWADAESLFGTTVDANSSNANDTKEDETYLKANFVSVTPQNDAIKIGNSAPIIVTVPGALNYSLKCKSSNPAIAKVNDKGVITAVGSGKTVITVTVTIDKAKKSFEFIVHTFANKAVMS
ncbi:Ig-like domain-containing protein [Oscillospiraceae bacterium PP1C4]